MSDLSEKAAIEGTFGAGQLPTFGERAKVSSKRSLPAGRKPREACYCWTIIRHIITQRWIGATEVIQS
jgi:hypothetical protein